MTAEPVDALDWRTTLDALLEHPATWRHIAVQAELASRRHPDGWTSHTALRRLAWAAADMAYLTAGALPPVEVLTTMPDTHCVWDYRTVVVAQRGPLTTGERAAYSTLVGGLGAFRCPLLHRGSYAH